MPPKSSAVCPPRRSVRNTPRKSKPYVPPKSAPPITKPPESPPSASTASNSSSPITTSLVKETATAAAPLASPGKLNYTISSITRNSAANLTTLASPGKLNDEVSSITRNSAANLTTSASAEKLVNSSVDGTITEAKNAVESGKKTQFRTNPNVESVGDIGSDEVTVPAAAVGIGAENAVVGETGSAKTGTRNVVRRTVRVVKKVVKKKVPRRVLRSQAGPANDETEEKTDAAEEKPEAVSDGEIGDSVVFSGDKSVLMEVDKLNFNGNCCMEIESAKKTEKHNAGTDDLLKGKNLKEIEKLNDDTVCGDIEIWDIYVTDLNEVSNINCIETGPKEAESLNANVTLAVEVDSLDSVSRGFGSEVDRANPDIDFSGTVDKKGSENHEGERARDEVLPVPIGLDSSGDKSDVDLVDTAVDVAQAIVEHQNAVLKQNQLLLGTIEGQSARLVELQTVDNVEDKLVELTGHQKDEGETRDVDVGSGECEEAVKEEVVNGEAGALKRLASLSEKILLSGEMEALERRRRRRTELFIGGLDKDTKEEDIRKVFKEAGEIAEVRLMMNGKTGKNKGFAFVRYASADDAKKALAKFQKVEICGKQCGSSLVEGNDTIFLGNIDKNWKTEDVAKVLKEIGIEKIDKVTVMVDPNNVELNRGFAFLELETSKDAQIAFNKLQKKGIFGKNIKIKVAWAEPLIELDEEEMLKVKSVYAEYLPSSWDEEKVKEHFAKFGEIENVALARNLRSSKRKDFAFINYKTREAALACIEAFRSEELNDESKVNMKVSLAKPMAKGKQIKQVSNATSKEPLKEKHKPARPVLKQHEPRKKGISISSNYENNGVGRRSSTNAELVQLLREQASWRQRQPNVGLGAQPIVGTGPRPIAGTGPRPIAGMDALPIIGMEARPTIGMGSVDLEPYPTPGRKRPFHIMGEDPLYLDQRGYPRRRGESSYPISSPSSLSPGVGRTALSYHGHQGTGYMSELYYGPEDYPSYLQTREPASYHGSSGLYRRY